MGARVGGKRKRGGAEARSEQDKFVHKSGVLLQREAKKVRAFQVRKVVQQLKQTRTQLESAQRELEALHGGGGDGAAVEKKSKQVNKMSGTVAKLEKELAVLKALDLKAVVARAMETTGLAKQRAKQQALARQQQEQQEQDGDSGSDDDNDSDGGHYGRRMADESGDDDDGFDSEEYERSRKPSGGAGRDDSGSESDSDSGDSDSEHGDDVTGASADASAHSAESKASADEPLTAATTAAATVERPQSADEQLEAVLIDRILAHKQMKPLLEAIEKVLEKDERELEKKLRRQEKKALKRERHEVLIGGRSAAAPTSLFLGSLSGRGDVLGDDDDFGMASGQMAGAEDDIAEFLGETKKKKNRMGQLARRQKALRMEEAAKRKQDRENGIFRPYAPRKDDAVSKYGPSERPKKKKAPTSDSKSSKRSSGSGKPEQRRGAPAPGAGSRERGAPPPAAAPRSSASSSRRPPAPPVEASHPSWIAKQALKEKQKASLGAFSGKKITFGDD